MKSKIQKKLLLLTLTAFCCSHVEAKKLLKAPQKRKGAAGIVTDASGNPVMCANPNFISRLNLDYGTFDNIYTLTNYNFGDDLAISSNKDITITAFLSGQLPTILKNGTVIQTNADPLLTAPETGVFQQKFDPIAQGVNPIAYRKSNNKIYTQGFDPSVILAFDLSGSVAQIITLSMPVGLNAMQFGPDDKLYAPAPGAGQLVKIDVESGLVTVILTDLKSPIALKVSSTGLIYFAERTTGNVYKFDLATGVKTLIATLEPSIDNLCLSLSENKLFVTNAQNKIYKVSIANGKITILYQSPITQPWDVAFDGNKLFVADSNSLKQVNPRTGEIERILILDSETSGLNGFGIAGGLEVEPGPDGNITLADITLCNFATIKKSDFSVVEFIDGFTTGLFTKSNFSTIRVTDGTPNPYYLALNAVDGIIVKVYRDESGNVITEPYFSDLRTPVKLKQHNGYIYVVEAGLLTQGVANSGRVSRIPLSNTPPPASSKQVLLDNLSIPQGLDINEDTIYVLETGKSRLISGSATSHSSPVLIANNYRFTGVVLISNLNPIPYVNPFAGLAYDPIKKKFFVVQTDPNNIKITYKNF